MSAAQTVKPSLNLGVIGKLLQCVPDWCRVSVDGQKGWVPKTALWGVDKAEVYP